MNWEAIGAVSELLGAIGQIAIAGIAVYIAYRQWIDSKRDAREQQELTEKIERNKQAVMQEQERIIRSQSLDAYFEGISNLLLRDGNPSAPFLERMVGQTEFGTTAQKFAKGRTDALLKILKADEKRNLIAFLYGSGLITLDGDSNTPIISLSGSDLSGADLHGATLREASVNMTNLRGADLRGADLSDAYLRGADLTGADLRGADVSLADLHGANLSKADLSGVYLSEADLSGADLREANFSEAYLDEANLSGANLHGADLSEADLSAADLSGANLRAVNLSTANLRETGLTNLISINGADFTDVENLSEETKEYLASIAEGTHPVTKRDTQATLERV